MSELGDAAIAVIGLACRLPGAATPAAFWDNLVHGRESITAFDAAGARIDGQAGEPPIAAEGEVIRAAGILDEPEGFDCELFGYSPLEATMIDPQQRIFLECAYEALDAAGCDPRRHAGTIGVYAGGSETPYLALLRAHRAQLAGATDWQLRLATGIDFLTSRAAYKLGLRGPAVTIQTACSTSLVAIHVAAQALLGGDCDLALAGGATVNVPLQLGTYAEGGVLSPDGRCRAFDARAQGTAGGDGVVVVALKRLADALADRDHVHAVLAGSAINNDAEAKVGFTAPGVEGQVQAIRAALAAAQAAPGSIGFVEAHGTGTALGDPIEVAALNRVFAGARRGPCLLGSVKTNIGHTDAAAGAAGFLKAVLAIEHGRVPPTLHFTAPNPRLELERGPFAINTAPAPWPELPGPRRAGVSSFGIGGTNAHAVLEQAPPPPPAAADAAAAGPQLLVLSACSRPALERAARELAAHLGAGGPHLADVAWTLQSGRQEHGLRRFVVGETAAAAAAALAAPAAPALPARSAPRVVFMFPGQGGQHAGMARGLYRTQRVFREAVDRCARLAAPALGLDLGAVITSPPDDADARTRAARLLDGMEVAQAAVFAVEIALAELWRHWGVEPDAVVGHSLGAYAAAVVAGALSLEDALALVLARSRLLAQLPPGAMLAVPLPEAQLAGRLGGELAIAAVNAAAQCTVSGPAPAIAALRRALAADGVDARVLHIPRSAHSPAIEPLLGEYEACVRRVALAPPRLPWASDMTGGWVTPEAATDPRYYVEHLRRTVRFADALSTVMGGERAALLELGPGRALSTLARQHPRAGDHLCVAALPHPADPTPDHAAALTAVGQLWAAGAAIAWAAVHDGAPRRRVPLPTYAFDRRRCALERGEPAGSAAGAAAAAGAADPAPPPADPAPPGAAGPRVAAVFGAVLGLAEVAPHANFFELGGDSLMAAQLAARLRATFPGLDLRPRAVFRAPTIDALSRLIDESAATDPGSP